MPNSFTRLAVRKDTFDLVTQTCKEVFLKDNPDLEGFNITNDFIVKRIANYYINQGKI